MSHSDPKLKTGGEIPAARTESPPESHQGLAWVFVVLTVLLLSFMCYFTCVAVLPLTQPSVFFQDLTSSYFDPERLGSDPDELTVNLAILLEYANADIRTAGVQVAFSLVGGTFFTLIGVLLLGTGVTGRLDLTGKHGETGFRLVSGAPGLVAILIGGVIILAGVLKDVERPLNASVARATGMSLATDSVEPTEPANAEGPADDQITSD